MLDTNAHYTTDIPYTYWQEKVNNGVFYNSKSSANQPFARNNEFLKNENSFAYFTG